MKDDALGKAFTHDIRAAGVAFTTPPATDGPSTARCYVLVTPDGERTMNTYLGAAQNLTPADLDDEADRVGRRSPISKAICGIRRRRRKPSARRRSIAHGAGRKVALTLSDAFCVGRYRDEFLNLMRTGAVDLIFANESELKSLYETADFDTAVAALRNDVKLAVVTRSEKGCVVVSRESNEVVRGGADRQARRCDRRGRSVRRGISRPDLRAARTTATRAARRASRPRK